MRHIVGGNSGENQAPSVAEYKITRLPVLVHSIGAKIGMDECNDEELEQLQQEVKPKRFFSKLLKAVLGKICSRIARATEV